MLEHQLRIVGSSVPRIEGRAKVTGATHYAVDVALPGMLWAGRAINPALLQAQIDGATIQGLGQALMEDLGRQAGRTQASNLGDYKVTIPAAIANAVAAACGARVMELPVTAERVLAALRANGR